MKIFWQSFFVGAIVFGFIGILSADASVTKAALFYNGAIVGTVGKSESIPKAGIDPLYIVTNGASGQLAVASTGPGDVAYSGGQWAMHLATFNPGVEPYLLTSQADVREAEARGALTVERAPDLDRRLETKEK